LSYERKLAPDQPAANDPEYVVITTAKHLAAGHLLKLLLPDGHTPQGWTRKHGVPWPMPTETNGSWLPGEWVDVSGRGRKLEPCSSGSLHGLTPKQAIHWDGGSLWWVETAGPVKDAGDKSIFQRGRVLCPALSLRAGYLFAIDCARHVSDLWADANRDLLTAVLDIYTAEALYGKDWNASAAIASVASARDARAARAARGARAASAAWAARDAWDARDAWAARDARDARAARAASAAWAARAARDASAAWAAECAWQVERLTEYLDHATEWGDA